MKQNIRLLVLLLGLDMSRRAQHPAESPGLAVVS